MTLSTATQAAQQRRLSLFDSVCVIVGIIIGAGIFETTPIVAANALSVSNALLQTDFLQGLQPWENEFHLTVIVGIWLLGGAIALLGALCYAELTTTYTQPGGDYLYHKRAYGRPVAFMFVWVSFWIVRPANIGAMAFVFANYGQNFLPNGENLSAKLGYACLAVLLLTLANLVGIRGGKWTQNLLSTIKVVGLLTIFAFALSGPWQIDRPATAAAPVSPGVALGLAMVMVMFSFGGWNDIAFVSAEVKRPEKNLFRSLMWGIVIVTVIYVLLTISFVMGLGLDGVAQSQAVASDLLSTRFGDWGQRFISGLICISALGAINGTLLTGARVYYVLGTEHPLFAWVGRWKDHLGGPYRAVIGQTIITLLLVILFGRSTDGFQRIVYFSTPCFWGFFALAAFSIYLLRRKDRDLPRPFRVPLYPLTPLLFGLSSLYMLVRSTQYAWQQRNWEAIWTLAIVAVGVLVSLAWRRNQNDGQKNSQSESGCESYGESVDQREPR